MKKNLKILLSAIICITLMLSVAISAMAATASINMGYSGTLNPGNTITVNITVTSSAELYAYDAIVQYNTNYLQLVTTSDGLTSAAGSFVVNPTSKSGAKTLTATAQFKLLKAGNTTIKVLEGAAGDGTNQGVSVPAKNLTLSITAPTKSDDNTLKSLTVGAGTLTPAFSRYVTEYKVTVPYSVDYFDINAVPNDDKATREYSTGDRGPEIKVGTTVRTITVTAENGSVRKYNITVTRLPNDSTSATSSATSSITSSADTSSTVSEPEENKLETIVDGNKMSVAEIIPDNVNVVGFAKGEYTFNSVHVPAFLSKDEKTVILYLLNEEGSGALYMYDSATGTFSSPCFVDSGSKYTIIPVTSIARDQLLIDTENVFNLSTITIGEQEVEAYVYKDDALSDFAIVCAINSEGEKEFYRYDKLENTLQRYIKESRADIAVDSSSEDEITTDAIVVLVCAAVCLAAIIAIVIIWAVRRRYYDDDFDDDFDDAEPLFIKEAELDTTDEGETLTENENQPDTKENEAETETEEE